MSRFTERVSRRDLGRFRSRYFGHSRWVREAVDDARRISRWPPRSRRPPHARTSSKPGRRRPLAPARRSEDGVITRDRVEYRRQEQAALDAVCVSEGTQGAVGPTPSTSAMRSPDSIRSKACPTRSAIARGSASSAPPRSSTSSSPRRAGESCSRARRRASAEVGGAVPRAGAPGRRAGGRPLPGAGRAVRRARAEEECPDA